MKAQRTTLRPIDFPRSLAEDAADRIREQVLVGGYRQGEHLVEAKIADELNISRGPVREAFKMLRAEGLLTEEPRRGTFVVSITAQDVRDIYGLRAAVEALAAKLIVRADDPGLHDSLDKLVGDIAKAASKGDAAAVARADVAFHAGVCALSGNARLAETFNRYVPVLRGLLRMDERIMPSLEDVPGQHAALVDAIKAGDEDEVGRLFSQHSEDACGLLIALLEGAE